MHPGHLVSEHATKWSIEARRRDVLILLARSGLRKLGLWQTTQLRAVETVRGGRRLESARVWGVFGRRWTHNEQLMVRPCGVVIGRATFYASESLSGVKVSPLYTSFVWYGNVLSRTSSIAFSHLERPGLSPTSSSLTMHADCVPTS